MIEHERSSLALETEMINQLENWAIAHADESAGLLKVIPRDSPDFPSSLDHHIKGQASDDTLTDMIAEKALVEHYPSIKEYVVRSEIYHQEISRLGEYINDGGNVVVVCNHSDLADIAYTQAVIYGELYRQGYRPKTSIIISEMVRFLSYKVDDEYIPAIKVLQLLEDDILLSYPTTPSTKSYFRHTAMNAIMKKNNAAMRRESSAELKAGGVLMAIAPSGTTDKPDSANPSLIHLGGIDKATRRILATEGTMVLPVAISYGKNQETFFEFASIPKPISPENSTVEVDSMMHLIAETLSQGVDGYNFIYDEPSN